MLATPERIRGRGGAPDTTVWHKPVGECRGECDFHAIACSDDEGIVLPGGTRNVPLNLDKLGEEWCPACLALAPRRLTPALPCTQARLASPRRDGPPHIKETHGRRPAHRDPRRPAAHPPRPSRRRP